MSIDVGQVDRALAILGPGARIDVAGERIGLLRYAKSRVTAQHTEDRLRVRVTRDGRAVSGTLETLDADAVRTLGSRLSEALAVLPAGTAAGSAASTPDPVRAPAVSAAVLRAGATDRHAWLDAIRANLGSPCPWAGRSGTR